MEDQFKTCALLAGSSGFEFTTQRLSAVREVPLEPPVVWRRFLTTRKHAGFFEIKRDGEWILPDLLSIDSVFQLTRYFGWPLGRLTTSVQIHQVIPGEEIELVLKNRWLRSGLLLTIGESRPGFSLIMLVEVWRSPVLFLMMSQVERLWLAATHNTLQALFMDAEKSV